MHARTHTHSYFAKTNFQSRTAWVGTAEQVDEPFFGSLEQPVLDKSHDGTCLLQYIIRYKLRVSRCPPLLPEARQNILLVQKRVHLRQCLGTPRLLLEPHVLYRGKSVPL